jgi:hypothetical protein
MRQQDVKQDPYDVLIEMRNAFPFHGEDGVLFFDTFLVITKYPIHPIEELGLVFCLGQVIDEFIERDEQFLGVAVLEKRYGIF